MAPAIAFTVGFASGVNILRERSLQRLNVRVVDRTCFARSAEFIRIHPHFAAFCCRFMPPPFPIPSPHPILCPHSCLHPHPFFIAQVIGATVGRLIGEVLAVNLSESWGVVPSTFALVGAAAMSCGATQTISAAVVRPLVAYPALALVFALFLREPPMEM